jgi:hypothetical protein
VKGYVKKHCFELIFLLLQATLYATFLTLDLTGGRIGLSVIIKYTIIILCFCYALLTGGINKSIFFCGSNNLKTAVGQSLQSKLRKDQHIETLMLQAGLFFTLISDLFILILDYYFYGVVVFILVQQLYSFRLILLQYESRDSTKKILFYGRRVTIQVGLTAIVCFVLLLVGISLDRLLIASVFYFISILFNTISAFGLAINDCKKRSTLLYAVGMFLFLLCDINVGLFNLTGFIKMPKEIYSVIYSYSSILMWTFYAPSQVLIALSISYIGERKETSK